MKHTLAWADETSRSVRLDYRPVHTYTMTNEVKYIEPEDAGILSGDVHVERHPGAGRDPCTSP